MDKRDWALTGEERESKIRAQNSRFVSNDCACDWCFILRLLDAERATVQTQAATIRRSAIEYLALDGQAIELQGRLREVEAERDAEKARADAAEAKVRAVVVESLRSEATRLNYAGFSVAASMVHQGADAIKNGADFS